MSCELANALSYLKFPEVQGVTLFPSKIELLLSSA